MAWPLSLNLLSTVRKSANALMANPALGLEEAAVVQKALVGLIAGCQQQQRQHLGLHSADRGPLSSLLQAECAFCVVRRSAYGYVAAWMSFLVLLVRYYIALFGCLSLSLP